MSSAVIIVRNFFDSAFLPAGISRLVLALQFICIAKIAALYFALAEVGLFFLLYNLVLLFSTTLFSSQSAGLLRFFSLIEDKTLFYRTLLHQLIIGVLIAIAGFCIFLGISSGSADLDVMAAAILLHGISTGCFLNLITKFRAASEFRKMLVYTLLQFCFNALIIGLFVFGEALTPITLIISMALSNMVCIGIFTVSHRRIFGRILLKKNDHALNMEIWRFGIPLVAVALFNLMLSANSQMILKTLGFDQELGVYAANYNVGEKIIFIVFSLLVTVKVPELYRGAKRSLPEALALLKRIIFSFSVFCVIALIFSGFFSRHLSYIFTSQVISDHGHWVIPLTVISASLLGVASLCSEVLLFLKRSATLAYCFGAGVVVNLSAGFILISQNGIVGAAVSSILANLVLLCIILWLSHKTLKRMELKPHTR